MRTSFSDVLSVSGSGSNLKQEFIDTYVGGTVHLSEGFYLNSLARAEAAESLTPDADFSHTAAVQIASETPGVSFVSQNGVIYASPRSAVPESSAMFPLGCLSALALAFRWRQQNVKSASV